MTIESETSESLNKEAEGLGLDNILPESYHNFVEYIKNSASGFNIDINEENKRSDSLDDVLNNCKDIENNIYSSLLKTSNRKLVLDYQKNIISQKLKYGSIDEYINLKNDSMDYHNIRYSNLKKSFPFLFDKIKGNKSLITIFYEAVNEYNKNNYNAFDFKLPNWFNGSYVKIQDFIEHKQDSLFTTKDLRNNFENKISDYLLYQGIDAAIDRGLIKRVSKGNYEIISKMSDKGEDIVTYIESKEIINEELIKKKSVMGKIKEIMNKKKENVETIIKKKVIFEGKKKSIGNILNYLDYYKSNILCIYSLKFNYELIDDENYYKFEKKLEKNHNISFLLTCANQGIDYLDETYDYLSDLFKSSIDDFRKEKIFPNPQKFYDFMNAYLACLDIKSKEIQNYFKIYSLKNKLNDLVFKTNNSSFNYLVRKNELIKKGIKIFNKFDNTNTNKISKSLNNLIKKTK